MSRGARRRRSALQQRRGTARIGPRLPAAGDHDRGGTPLLHEVRAARREVACAQARRRAGVVNRGFVCGAHLPPAVAAVAAGRFPGGAGGEKPSAERNRGETSPLSSRRCCRRAPFSLCGEHRGGGRGVRSPSVGAAWLFTFIDFVYSFMGFCCFFFLSPLGAWRGLTAAGGRPR